MTGILNFVKSYWPVVVLGAAVLLPRLFLRIPEEDFEFDTIPRTLIYYHFGTIIGLLILFSGWIYWILERKGYRFYFVFKVIHLVCSYPFLLIAALFWYDYHSHQSGSEMGILDGFTNMGRLARLDRMRPPAFVMLLVGQLIAVVHFGVVLFQHPAKQRPEVLDSPD